MMPVYTHSRPVVNRLPDWQARLNRFIEHNRHRKFEYGRWDCALFVASAIWIMTGVDPAQKFRDVYRGHRGALKLMLSECGEPSVSLMAAHVFPEFGFAEVPPLRAKRGDVVAILQGQRELLGIVSLDGLSALVVGDAPDGSEGIGSVPLSAAFRAWSV
jgi:hypothetical protein